jgi:hypothetical protein
LVGQDLIKAAEIRSTIASIESYNAAANTFRNKFNGLPGDLLASRASQYGLTSRTGAAGMGNGNALLEGCAANQTHLGCETGLFWRDLTSAQLLPTAFNTATNAAAENLATSTAVADYLPKLSIRDTAFVHIFSFNGRNHFYLGGLTTGAAGAITTADAITPAEAAQIDEKVDDGLPRSGIVRAVEDFTATSVNEDTGAASGTGVCVSTSLSSGPTYNNAQDEFQSQVNCRLYWRASF